MLKQVSCIAVSGLQDHRYSRTWFRWMKLTFWCATSHRPRTGLGQLSSISVHVHESSGFGKAYWLVRSCGRSSSIAIIGFWMVEGETRMRIMSPIMSCTLSFSFRCFCSSSMSHRQQCVNYGSVQCWILRPLSIHCTVCPPMANSTFPKSTRYNLCGQLQALRHSVGELRRSQVLVQIIPGCVRRPYTLHRIACSTDPHIPS